MLISLVLFLAAIFGGVLNFLVPEEKSGGIGFKLSLVFAGSYLFSITIIHLIPNLYTSGMKPLLIGVYILLGFFLQQILEYFTSGIEHGHLHSKSETHQHHALSAMTVLIALSIHAFMEGTLLSNPQSSNQQTTTLSLGIILHKVPAAFALMSLLLCQLPDKKRSYLLLLVFAFATPVGSWISQMGIENSWLTSGTLTILFALVSGSFLHISTTIVFESSPTHTFNFKKLLVAAAGAFTAVGFEFFS